MSLRIWRFITIMLTALSMGTVFCHLMEMPAKRDYDGAMWLTLLQTLYRTFGTIGAVFEVGAPIAAVILVFLVRHRRPAFKWTIVGAVCLLVAHAAYWALVAPVNATMVPLSVAALPPNWESLRDQWEYTHAARALLQIAALGALVWSVIAETFTEHRAVWR